MNLLGITKVYTFDPMIDIKKVGQKVTCVLKDTREKTTNLPIGV